jgi:hypothetical protein
MNAKMARVLSITLFGLYLLLIVPSLYYQWYSGKVLYGGVNISLNIFIGGGFMAATWAAIGTFIVWHYPSNWIGWIMCLFPIGYALDHFTWAYYQFSVTSGGGSQPATLGSLMWQNVTDIPPYTVLFGLLFLIFPSGRFLSPRWRRVAWIGVLAFLSVTVLELLKPGPLYPEGYIQMPDNPLGVSLELWGYVWPLYTISQLASIAFLISAVISLVLRLKHSRGEERQQIKWFAYFAAIFPITFVVIAIFDLIGYTGTAYNAAATLVLISFLGMAIAIAFAIFRYRLYAIDIIIRRTLQYTLLTGLLALIYFGSVVLLQRLFENITGQQSPVVIVISTLAIAALFNPLRIRVHEFIDRRFYRSKYDAERALTQFAETARDEVDIDKLTEALLEVVVDTVQPERVSIWLR